MDRFLSGPPSLWTYHAIPDEGSQKRARPLRECFARAITTPSGRRRACPTVRSRKVWWSSPDWLMSLGVTVSDRVADVPLEHAVQTPDASWQIVAIESYAQVACGTGTFRDAAERGCLYRRLRQLERDRELVFLTSGERSW